MNDRGPTSFLLNGRLGWRTAAKESVQVAVDASGIRLGARPGGPLSLAWGDGSLGGLVLPRGMALDERWTLFLLDLDPPWRIRRYVPARGAFVPLPAVGGKRLEARGSNEPRGIAVAGSNLYVADTGNSRVQVFDADTVVLRHLWRAAPVRGGGEWEPYDVAARGDRAYILDRRHGRVYCHRVGSNALEPCIDEPEAAGRWTRIAVDREMRLYLLDEHRPKSCEDGIRSVVDEHAVLWVYESGHKVGEIAEPGDVRSRFDPPPVRLFYDRRVRDADVRTGGYFCLPASMRDACVQSPPKGPPPAETPLALCPPWTEGQGQIYDRRGRRVQLDAADLHEPPVYCQEGTWIGEMLDSQIYHCQWHRIELELDPLPPGTTLTISTYSSDETSRPVARSPEWQVGYRGVGRTQAPSRPADTDPPEFLVQSREGQHLWLKIELSGDGYGSPAVRSMRVHYPRQSYLDYLPRIYASDESRWFLERFLSIFQTEWDDLERRIAELAILVDPDAVPAGPLLENLARWVAQPLERTWKPEQQRSLLQAVPRVLSRRGTPDGLRAYLRAYLHSLAGIEPDDQGDYPQIVEGFRERQRVMLATEGLAQLGHSPPLWGPAAVGRLQLDVYARADEVKLVSTRDPERDLFHEHAHRFRVYMPAAWVHSAEDERVLRRALDAEKPAFAGYELCLVEPRFRVGIQSTVGLDTIVGGIPAARLSCKAEAESAPPSQAPRNRLGWDTVLSSGCGKPPHLPARIHTIVH